MRDLVILEGIWRLDRRLDSALKVFHKVFVSDSSLVWKASADPEGGQGVRTPMENHKL